MFAVHRRGKKAAQERKAGRLLAPERPPLGPCIDSSEVEKAMTKRGKVTVEREGRTYGAEFEVKGDMVRVKTHTETRSVALGGRRPEDVARYELEEIIRASDRH